MRRHAKAPVRKFKPVKALDTYGQTILADCARIWRAANGLDTAVRDDVAQGLTHLVRSAYDSLASNMNIKDTTAWTAFIDNSTAEWFRQRGFAEWFCAGAATGFRTSRPRTLAALESVGPRLVRRIRGGRVA